MNKALAVLKREYLQTVRKKMFLVMTILVPVLFAALMWVPMMVVRSGMGGKKIVIVDGSGALKAITESDPSGDEGQNFTFEYIDAHGQSDLQKVAEPWLSRLAAERKQRVDGVLVIPPRVVSGEDQSMTYYSRSATELRARSILQRRANREIQRLRLLDHGIGQDEMNKLLARAEVETVQLSKTGEEKKGGEMDFIAGFVFAGMLILPSIFYGVEVMRGVVQEKTDRVVEILVSSMTPMQLLSGKIFGLALVGLTQLGIWIGVAALLGIFAGGGAMMVSDINLAQFLRLDAFIYFFIFFLLAYMLYVCVYAIAGAVSNSEKEAQQFVSPVIMILMIPWFLMMPIIFNPDAPFSVFLSLFPLFAPITMFVRTLVSEPPLWQIVTAIVLSMGTIWGMLWLTGKIFRVGILSYGKRPTIPELWRWLKVA